MIILSFSAARPPGPAAAAGKFFFRAGKAAKNAKKRLTSAALWFILAERSEDSRWVLPVNPAEDINKL